jgi:flagellar hook-associated protein FlgK
MSLSLALNNALTGLNVNQKALSVTSQNIANANTEGYSRQIIQQSAQYINGVGVGVRIDDIMRNVDKYLQRSLTVQGSSVGRTETIKTYHDRLQVLLGEPGGNNTLDEYLGNFFDTLQALAETPERVSFREAAVDSGIVLAREISSLAAGLHDLRLQADLDLKEGVRTVNLELQKIDSLNVAISNANALGNSTAGLMDQLDLSLAIVANYMDISTYVQENGAVHVYTANGIGLVDDNLYQLTYRQARGTNDFIDDVSLSPLEVVRVNEDGSFSRDRTTLISGGRSGSVTTVLNDGQFLGLKQLRDKIMPDIIEQLDNLAAMMRDTFNALHNDGSSFPGTSELSGTRSVLASDRSDWSGSVRIAVLDGQGRPVLSPYGDEAYTGIRPLTMDLTKLNSGFGNGQPTMQTIVDEINNHFFPPPVKAKLGNLNNIQLVSNTNTLPDIPPRLTFDFDLDNISATSSEFFVTGIRVLDDTATNITNVVGSTRPQISLDLGTEYTTTFNSDIVRVNAAGHGLSTGDKVFLSDPGGPVDGIPQALMTGYFEVINATAGYFEIRVAGVAATGGTFAAVTPGVTAIPKWDEIAAGEKRRVRDQGTVTVDFSANTASGYYDIEVDVGVYDGTIAAAQIPRSTITFRVFNNSTNMLNDRFNNVAVTGAGQRVVGSTSQPSLIAKLVDENGVELAKNNGVYVDQPGFLKLETFDPDHTISIDEMNSRQLGITSTTPTAAGTNRGFSHFFELNNFFESNAPTATGDTKRGSAINLKVEDRIVDNANLISLGSLVRTRQSSAPDALPLYTYERNIADNTIIQSLSKVGLNRLSFDAAGGIADVSQTLAGYTGEILGFLAANAVQAEADFDDTRILFEGFQERLDAMKGVNIDEELANTILYQHAYTASARIVTVTDELFQVLLGIGQ